MWKKIRRAICVAVLGICSSYAFAGDEQPVTQPRLDLVATAHLDTEWRWSVRDTIRLYLPDTFLRNKEMFAKYPRYVFNFEGGIRYMFLKQYYPDLFEALKPYVQDGRWNISGPGLVAFDVNLPAPESLIRSILYAQKFYCNEFSTNAPDVFLPDCFGFSYALPTIAAHCGMKGFATQKLGWDCSVGIPFRIGFWQGVDGSILPSVMHAELYTSIIRQDLTRNPTWLAFAEETGRLCGAPRAYHLFGTGDQGGAPDEGSIAWAEGFYSSDGPLKVCMARSKDLFYDLNASNITQQPLYDGELLLTRHGTGGYTSKALIKKWNRQCEQLAAAAEHAAVAAYVLCGKKYPREKIQKTWIRLLLHHFHDSVTGVSIPEVNHMILDDLSRVQKVFGNILDESVAAWSRSLDTQVPGTPIVVYNPSAYQRESMVEFEWPNPGETSVYYRIFNADGREIPLQVGKRLGDKQKLSFLADVPSVGLAVFSLQTSSVSFCVSNQLVVTSNRIENTRYRVVLDDAGNISSIYDHMLGKELLSAPIQLQMLEDYPWDWPEWEITYDTVCGSFKEPQHPVITIEEDGPLRATLRVERERGSSVFVDHISLFSEGPVDRVHVRSVVDWHMTGTLAKIAFPFSFGTGNAIYDIGVGVVGRMTNTPALYEVPAQQWACVLDNEQQCGAAVINDCKYGWDHPQTNILRMTVLHSPNDITIDMGRHEYEYEIMGFSGSWTNGVLQAAEALNQPLYTFATDIHAGKLGNSSSLICLPDDGLKLLALKQAEEGENIILRLAEGWGVQQTNVKIEVMCSVEEAWLVNGVENVMQPIETDGNVLSLSFTPYSIKTVALCVSTGEAARLVEPARPRVSRGGTNTCQTHTWEYVEESSLLPDNEITRETPVPRGTKHQQPARPRIPRGGTNTYRAHTWEYVEESSLLPDNEITRETPVPRGTKHQQPSRPRIPRSGTNTCRTHSVSLPVRLAYDEDITRAAKACGDSEKARWFAEALWKTNITVTGIEHVLAETGHEIPDAVSCYGQAIMFPEGEYDAVSFLAASLGGDKTVEFQIGGQIFKKNIPDFTGSLMEGSCAMQNPHRQDSVNMRQPVVLKDCHIAETFDYCINEEGMMVPYKPGSLFHFILPVTGNVERLVLPVEPNVKMLAVSLIETQKCHVQRLRKPRSETIVDANVYPGCRFIRQAAVTLTAEPSDADIHYTLDGALPTRESMLYTNKLVIKSNAFLRARAFFEGYSDQREIRLKLDKHRLIPGKKMRGMKPGLKYSFYKGNWSSLPDTSIVTTQQTGYVKTVCLPECAVGDQFALDYSGYLMVPIDDVYTFYLTSDDGASLYVDGIRVIDNDGLHSPLEKKGTIALGAGYHAIEVRYFEAAAGEMLELQWVSNEMDKQPISPDYLYHDNLSWIKRVTNRALSK